MISTRNTDNERNYIAYFRVSTAKQGHDGLGMSAQRQAVETYTAGGVLLAEYSEVETGTSKRERPQLNAALDHCRRSGATLVIAKLDRLSRSSLVVNQLLESAVDFVAVDNASANPLTIRILAAIAESEAEAISSRTRDAMQAAKQRGQTFGTPANLNNADRLKGSAIGAAKQRQQAIDAYAAIMPGIMEARQQGQSMAAIASSLNQSGERTTRGSIFSAKQVSRLIARHE